MAVPITPEEVETFHEQGYLVLRNVFEESKLETLRAEADRILELLVNATLANERQSRRLTVVDTDSGQQIKKVQPVNDLSEPISQVSQDDRFIDPVRAVMRDDPVLMEEKLNYKQPLPERVPGLESSSQDGGWPIHNDWAYYKAQGYPRDTISAAVCLDDCTPETGPVHVWPGSHTVHYDHESTGGNRLQIPTEKINYRGGEDLAVPAGSVLLMHSLLVHSSRPNQTSQPRRVLTYSHYPDSEFQTYPDARNGPTRLQESPWEWEYQRKKRAGEYTDQFVAPTVGES